ncbi:MAG: carboxylesterase family protein, partial [Planctomycetota bacterium]
MTFLIGLTLAVVAFGGVKLTRAYRRKQERTEYARAERDIRQYAADLLQAEHEQLQDIAVIAQGPIGRDAAALLMQTRYLTASGAGRRPGESSQVAPRAFADIKENFNRIQKGLPRLFPTGRPFLRGYYSELDDTFQPYGVCLPRTYNGTRRYPLIITLDDYPSGEPFQCMDAPYYEGAISVKPQGRGATDYMHIGEDDVVKVLEEASAIYNIDRQRVYLTGASIGAMGCWNLAAHYPHLFAGIVPVDWSSQHRPPKQQRAELTGRAGAHQELKEFLSSALSPVSYAENLQYCHIAVVNYATDDVALMEQPRTMVERLRELAYPVDYLELPHAPAGASAGWARDYALAKVFGKASSGKPTQFRHKTASLRHGRAWWIRMGRLDDPVRFATVEAKLADARAEITTDNVSAVTVLLEEAPTTIRQVCVDGAEFPVLADLDAHGLQLVKWSGVWQRRTVVPLMKQMGLSGPFSDVLRDPFVVVYGTTSESEVQNEISYQEAARFAKDWQRLYGEEPRLKA